MSLSSIVRGLIINGGDSVAIARKDDAVYRLEPIAEITPISIENIEANTPKIVQLDNELTHDYRIVGVTADIPEDNNQELTKGSGRADGAYVTTEIRIVSKNKAVENIILSLSSYPTYINPMFIEHNDTWKIKTSRAVDKITFRCVPVIINKPITFS